MNEQAHPSLCSVNAHFFLSFHYSITVRFSNFLHLPPSSLPLLASICEGDTVIWEGSWLPSVYFDPLTSDPPSPDPFKTTSSEITTGENKFRVSVSCSPKGLSFEGTYVLDNGDGFESKSDEKNIMDSYTKTVYFGSGMTEFGPFVTLSCEKDGVLTVVRRYVSEKDARKSGWTEDAKDLLEVRATTVSILP